MIKALSRLKHISASKEWRSPGGDTLSELQEAVKTYKRDLVSVQRTGEGNAEQRVRQIKSKIKELEALIKQGEKHQSLAAKDDS